MNGRTIRTFGLAAVLMGLGSPAIADYDSHPGLRPENRCGMIPAGIGDPKDPGGPKSLHCQRLFWDLPATTVLGTIRVGAPFAEDPIPRFPNGVTDRIPPLYILDTNGDGLSDNGEGYEKPGPGRVRLCPDSDQVPYWKELLEADGSPKIGTDDLGHHSVDDASKPQTGPLLELSCRRGSRAYVGPWQTGTAVGDFDKIMGGQATRFENTARLDRDVAAGRTSGGKRIEWNTSTEFYNHFASHHAVCNTDPSEVCSNPGSPQSREAYDASNPNATCRSYQRGADGPDHPQGKGGCYAADEDPSCSGGVGGAFRNATQLPGRLTLNFADNRGMLGVEDQLWGCNHHVVTQLPPGSYGMTRLANFRLQKGGVVNSTNKTIYGAQPGQPIGGAVGEYLIQYFTEPANAPVKPINFMFNAIADAATTYYAPFTWNYHESEWLPPYDAAITNMAIHSHHRMVKGTMNLFPPAKPRLQSPNPLCGGMANNQTPTDLYTDWYWEDAPVCEYWKDPDGPVVIRKGQSVRTTCYVNNGVTPEAIKHGLVAGDVVESLRALGAPVPREPSTVPTSSWAPALADSSIGREFLYGTHPPNNYRVVYKCSNYAPNVPLATAVTTVENVGDVNTICQPNPTVDADGDYVDGPYVNNVECGGGLCQPGSIAFACIGEDEMCIGVALYYALPRLGGAENDEAMANLQEQNVDGVGTPGSTLNMDVAGICHDCEFGL
jgi:hypothetical protein